MPRWLEHTKTETHGLENATDFRLRNHLLRAFFLPRLSSNARADVKPEKFSPPPLTQPNHCVDRSFQSIFLPENPRAPNPPKVSEKHQPKETSPKKKPRNQSLFERSKASKSKRDWKSVRGDWGSFCDCLAFLCCLSSKQLKTQLLRGTEKIES